MSPAEIHNYQAYQQPPGLYTIAQMAGDQNRAEMAARDAAATEARRTSLLGPNRGLGMPGASQVAAMDPTQMQGIPAPASDSGYPAGYNPNGPETPANGIDASPGAYTQVWGSSQTTNIPGNLVAGLGTPSNPIANAGLGLLSSIVTPKTDPTTLATMASLNSLNGASSNGNSQVQYVQVTNPQTGKTETVPVPRAQVPWYYPSYSQASWDAGLPSGQLGGYTRGAQA